MSDNHEVNIGSIVAVAQGERTGEINGEDPGEMGKAKGESVSAGNEGGGEAGVSDREGDNNLLFAR